MLPRPFRFLPPSILLVVLLLAVSFPGWADTSQGLVPAAVPFAPRMGTCAAVTVHGSATWNEIIAHDTALKAQKADTTATQTVQPYMPVQADEPLAVTPRPTVDVPAAVPAGRQSVSVSLGANFQGLDDNNTSIPPDTHGAAGPNHLMVTLNTEVLIQDRSGTALSRVSLESFFTAALNVSSIFDPKIFYDKNSARFYFVAASGKRDAASGFVLAVSTSSNPLGTWSFYHLDGDATNIDWLDYPNLGYSDTFVTVSANMFSIASDSFSRPLTWVFEKADLVAGQANPSVTVFDLTGLSSTHCPVQTYDAGVSTQYLVVGWNPNFQNQGFLRLLSFTGTGDAPVLNALGFPSSSSWSGNFPLAPQLGSATGISTNDDRVINALYRNGSIWCAHAVALPPALPTHTAAQFWQINPATQDPIQTGRVDTFAQDGMFYYFPSIAVNKDNHALIGFTGSSASTYAGAKYAYRTADMAVGTTSAVMEYKAGEAPYVKTFGGTANRWGDYSATCVDPANDTSIWTLQEYAETPGTEYDEWGTWWAKVDFGSAPPSAVNLSGRVETPGTTPLCGLVLANGAFQFSCSGDGSYNLTNVPVDGQGQITLFGFVSGRAPYEETFTPTSATMTKDLVILEDTGSPAIDVTRSLTQTGSTYTLSGAISGGGTPLCGLVLANGVFQFTCSGDGSYNLANVPVDGTGQITFFAFVSGRAPYEETFTP